MATSFPGSLSTASLLPLEETLVAAGHVTTQNLNGKKRKSVGREGWQSIFIVAVASFVGFKTSSSR